MLEQDDLQKLIRLNHLPADIRAAGQTWVQVELRDESTGLSTTDSMGVSDFVDLILNWRAHGCHERPCSVLHLAMEHR